MLKKTGSILGSPFCRRLSTVPTSHTLLRSNLRHDRVSIRTEEATSRHPARLMPRIFEFQSQYYSQNADKSGFFGKFVTNIKQEIAKNKEMKENLKKFREEAEKLEHSDALKKARFLQIWYLGR